MSVHSASPSPLQTPTNGQVDDMPKGHCRYILLLPEIRGQRCACVGFSLNKDIPGSTCDCGHLACFHNKGPDASADQKQELDLLKRRLQHLEEQLSKGNEEVLDSVVSRLNEVEEHLEKSREEFSDQIKGAYRNVSMSWRSIQQAEEKSQQHDDQLRQIYDKLRDHDERLDRLHAGQLELRDADLSLEERIENLTETLEEEEELRLSAAMASRPPRRRSTSDTSSRPNAPLVAPLGAGAAPPRLPYPSPTGGPVISCSNNNNNNTSYTHRHQGYGVGNGHDARAPTPAATAAAAAVSQHHALPQQHHPSPRRPRAGPARPTSSTGPWTVHISLLPHAYVPMPFERNTTAYQRCLSRGLHQMVAVQGRDAASFRAAVEKAFGRFLRGREWMPLQAKLCDAETLQGLPMLRLLDESALGVQGGVQGGGGGGNGVMDRCDHEFLRRHCAVVDAHGVIDSLYIAMKRHTLSWYTLRHSPVFMDGLEACWAHDALLDTDPFDGDMAVDDEIRPAVGDIMTAVPTPLLQQAGLKRPLAEMSRSNSFSSASPGGAGAVASAVAAAGVGVGPGDGTAEEQARVKRTCPAPPQGAIVEIRRRDIKTA